MNRRTARPALPAALGTLAAAALLTACGGGGGTDSTDTTPPATGATVALSGTAAKGPMANAQVTVHAVKADGTLDATPLATTSTDDQGRYTLSFSGTKDQPYVVKVTARDGTTHRDEVTGQSQVLPAGFAMRALVMPAASGSVSTSASVTPFSELAVAAAERASGGITATNAAQAASTVRTLLGFDPAAVAVKAASTTASADEQKLAVLLTAVSQMAGSGALGCTSGSAGDKVKCVVDTMAAAASSSTMKLRSGSGDSARDVSEAIGTAVGAVLDDSRLSGGIGAGVMAAVAANLSCGSNCAPATGGAAGLAGAIASAKQLFTDIKADWSAMFSRGSVSAVAGGAANQQAFRFKTAADAAPPIADLLIANSGLLVMGADLYNDYQAGRTTLVDRVRAPGEMATNGNASLSSFNAAACTLYQDSANTVRATAPANARFVGCSVRYYVERVGSVTTDWGHGFSIAPAADGSFTWSSRARKRVVDCTGISNGACPVTATTLHDDSVRYRGTLTATLDDGSITGFTLKGEWPGAFASGGNTLVNARHSIDLAATQAATADGGATLTLAGTLDALDDGGARVARLVLRDGRVVAVPDGQGETLLSTVSLTLVASLPTAEFEGTLSAGDVAWDRSRTANTPTRMTLAGMFRTIGGGTVTEFLSGRFTATISGYGSYDASRPGAAGNAYRSTATFVGTVTAPGRPTLEMTLGGSSLDNGVTETAEAMTLQYRSLVNGTPRTVVNIAGTPGAGGNIDRYTLSESGSGLTMSWSGDPRTIALKTAGGTEFGVLNVSSGMVTFSDLSTMSLDIGL